MTRPKRVLVLAKGLGRGGTERLLVSGLAHLDRDRFEPEVAYVLPWKDALVPEVKAQGVRVHCLGYGRIGRLAWPQRLRRLMRRGRFDLVHSHMPSPAVAARLVARGGRPALVHTEHNVWPRYRPGTYWANALTYHRNAAVLAVSDGVAQSITPPWPVRSLPAPTVEVLIHGIDAGGVRRGPQARAAARQSLGIAEDVTVVGTVGNFTPKKDHSSLLKATALLVGQFPGMRLVLVGSGPSEQELRGEARRLGLDDVVVWTGSRGDVPELLPGLDVFVLSSRHEGLPIALIEAMASGLPCVATDVGGIPEVIHDGVDGLLVPAGQPDGLAAAIARVLTDDGLRCSLADRAVATSERFQLSSAVDRLQDVYEAVLMRRR